MCYNSIIHSSRKTHRGPVCRLLSLSMGLLGLTLAASCSQGPRPAATTAQVPVKIRETELRFDERYLDSISLGPPYSARTQRQLAILNQLKRLDIAKRSENDSGQNDSVYEHVGGGPLVGFPNRAAHLADIYRKIDSLKALEYISETPQ
jgi:hypothetical protein